MAKFRTMLFTLMAAGVLLSLSSVSANAQQWAMSSVDTQKYTNNPCSDPRISWGLWDETAGMSKPQGGVDCDPSNYDFSQVHKALDMSRQVREYRADQRKTLRLGAVSTSSGRRFQDVTDLRSGASIKLEVGRVVSQGGGNLLTSDGAGVIAQGGGNVIAQGGGNFRGVLATPDYKVVQMKGKWFKIKTR
jgi:hypothetical protein